MWLSPHSFRSPKPEGQAGKRVSAKSEKTRIDLGDEMGFNMAACSSNDVFG
jgi:hypothetical protein